jgi:hypothetical protein
VEELKKMSKFLKELKESVKAKFYKKIVKKNISNSKNRK